jgi:hypothetical protein
MDRVVRLQPLSAVLVAAALLVAAMRITTAGDHFGQRVAAPGCTGAACGHGHGHCSRGHCGPGHCGHGRHCLHGHCGRGPCGPGGCGPCGHCGGHGCGLCGPGSCKYDAWEKRYFLRSQGKSWHSAWYDPAEGRPIALVVPPTAEFQTQYGWGVPSSRVAPIYHQFRRPYPGPGAIGGTGGGGFLPTPNQPSDTVQFGVNAVRGPWGAY